MHSTDDSQRPAATSPASAAVGAGAQPGVERAAGLGGQDHPGFGLAKVGRIEQLRTRVVGMDLDRKLAARVEEFEQQRELGERRMAAEQLGAKVAHEIAELEAGETAIGNNALIGAVVDDLPALGKVVFWAE